MTKRRAERREARWMELRERTNDAAAMLHVATVRMTDAQYRGTAKEIDAAVAAVADAEKRYERSRSMLADFVAKSVRS
jgi:hypothetical protein